MTIHTFAVVANTGCPHAPEVSSRLAVEHDEPQEDNDLPFPVQETGQPEDTHHPDGI